MRRRDRYEGHVWLYQLRGESGQPHTSPHPHIRSNTPLDLDYLVSNLGLLVELEVDSGHYKVRCFPTPRSTRKGTPAFAASYSGENLASIPLAASSDYLAVKASPGGHTFRARENVRWVAP